ncbi:molybdate ABC transporter substrate-binding protein [Ramlibacter sp.]|uniref:molybdate ABC transporter substrate-binding protein n=1 Tax=Ramlibacter sp. TaxID=1917967 RepID=UPI002BEBA04E|nr:molybdate ABC transporter substrate-binding protein [Ramlibacter sp.]HWI83557.1 molybdate ABC transporter substrate-binding protein [Ramlibacter sp.]
MLGLLGLATAGWALATGDRAGAAPPIRVAAASDLKFALADCVGQYRRQSGQTVQVTFGSSGQFAQQIRHGLPVDLYLAADEAYVSMLAEAGLTRDAGAVYALGRIAALVPASSKLVLDPGLQALGTASPGIRAFAIANPEHAPYGRAARQALQRLGLWEPLRARLVLGENVAQATQYVSSGAAQAGITALSLALAPEVAQRTRCLALPAELHDPMRQRMVLLRRARREAAGFYDFMQGPAARAILQRHGFAMS